VRLADGRVGAVLTEELGPLGRPPAGDHAQIGRRAAALASAVRGVPYLWGGTSSWGFDCSGLVQWAYALAGRALPRDARDQIEVTRPVAPDESPRPGDLLFFSRDGQPGHVGLVTHPPSFVHAYSQVEEARLGPGPLSRPELRPACLGLRRPSL
jgi:cell wall-associated NlpC family hydrolase